MTHTILKKKKTDSGTQTKTSKRKHRRKILDWEDRLAANEVHNSPRKNMMNWTSSKLKPSTPWETLLRKQEDKPQTGSKYSQTTYLLKDSYLEPSKNSQNLIIQKEPNSKRKAKDLKRHFTEKDVQWQVNTQKKLINIINDQGNVN